MHWAHGTGSSVLEVHEADSMEFRDGVVLLFAHHAYVQQGEGPKEGPILQTMEELIQAIAIGPGQWVRLMSDEEFRAFKERRARPHAAV